MIDEALDRYLPSEESFPPSIHRAMRYSLFAGGKRLRPILAIASCEAVGGEEAKVLPYACALEMIHTYSLIHDDLPALDDDDYRRGVPTCHRRFGEAMAILAGDALLTEAFRLMSDAEALGALSAEVALEVINEIATSAGSSGMVGGQTVDVEAEGKEEVDPSVLHWIHQHKTGAMIRAAVRTGAKVGGAGEEELEAITRYGEAVGLAFQIVDDILDVEGEEAELGKEVGRDEKRGKATYPRVFGLEEAKEEARRLLGVAIDSLRPLDQRADPLRGIAHFVVARRI